MSIMHGGYAVQRIMHQVCLDSEKSILNMCALSAALQSNCWAINDIKHIKRSLTRNLG